MSLVHSLTMDGTGERCIDEALGSLAERDAWTDKIAVFVSVF